MPTFKYEAMDTTGGEVKDTVDAAERGRSPAEDPPDGLLRHQDHGGRGRQEEGQEEARPAQAQEGPGLHHRRRLHQAARAPSPASSRRCRTPACRCCAACKILEGQMKPGVLKNALIDVVDDVESRQHAVARRSPSTPSASTGSTSTWSRPARPAARSKSSSSASPTSRRRPRASSARITGAMVYPVVVISSPSRILTFIMIFIIPKFEKIFKDFKHEAAVA